MNSVTLNETAPRRFWKKVDKHSDPDGCWIWTGAKYQDGYGCFAYDGYRHTRAQRVSLILSGVEVPPKIHVHHLCGRPLCVNPRHLEVLSAHDHRLVHARWTREKILRAIRDFVAEFGRIPTKAEWAPPQARAQGRQQLVEQFNKRDWPHASSVEGMFGSWSAAMVAAGFEPRRRGVRVSSRVCTEVTAALEKMAL